MNRTLYPLPVWVLLVIGMPLLIIIAGLILVISFDRSVLTFDGAQYWWIAALIPLAGGLMVLGAARRRRALTRFAGTELVGLLCPRLSPARKLFRASLLVLAILALGAAILGPRWGMYLEKQKVRGVDIVVALDVSRSMLAKDLEPNRIGRAKRELRQQLTERGVFQGANRLGLVAFAGAASMRVPLTTDHAAFRNKLEQLRVGSVSRGGTALAKAIDAAADLFAVSPAEATKIILLVSDGEDHEPEAVETAKAIFEEQGIRVYTVAAGDTSSSVGAQVPMNESPGAPPLLHEGQIVFSKVAGEELKAIAAAAQGEYAPLQSFNRMVARIASMEGKELGTEERLRHRPQYQWFAAVCMLLLYWEAAMGETKPAQKDELIRTWQKEAA